MGVNKKREKILQIHGYKEKDDQIDNDDDAEEKTLFVNLNRIFQDQIQREETKHLILDDPLMQSHNTNRNTNNYLTENPQSKTLNKFPLKFTQGQVAKVQI